MVAHIRQCAFDQPMEGLGKGPSHTGVQSTPTAFASPSREDRTPNYINMYTTPQPSRTEATPTPHSTSTATPHYTPLNTSVCPFCTRALPSSQLSSHLLVCNRFKEERNRKQHQPMATGTTHTPYTPYTPYSLDEEDAHMHGADTSMDHPSPGDGPSKEGALRDPKGASAYPRQGSNGRIPFQTVMNRVAKYESAMKQCPHCQRNFGPSAFAHHVDVCKNVRNRPKGPSFKSSTVR